MMLKEPYGYSRKKSRMTASLNVSKLKNTLRNHVSSEGANREKLQEDNGLLLQDPPRKTVS